MEYDRLSLKNNLIGVKQARFEIPNFNYAMQIFSVVFLGHHVQLFSIRYTILNLFYFLENLVFIGWQFIPFYPETFTYSGDLS